MSFTCHRMNCRSTNKALVKHQWSDRQVASAPSRPALFAMAKERGSTCRKSAPHWAHWAHWACDGPCTSLEVCSKSRKNDVIIRIYICIYMYIYIYMESMAMICSCWCNNSAWYSNSREWSFSEALQHSWDLNLASKVSRTSNLPLVGHALNSRWEKKKKTLCVCVWQCAQCAPKTAEIWMVLFLKTREQSFCLFSSLALFKRLAEAHPQSENNRPAKARSLRRVYVDSTQQRHHWIQEIVNCEIEDFLNTSSYWSSG